MGSRFNILEFLLFTKVKTIAKYQNKNLMTTHVSLSGRNVLITTHSIIFSCVSDKLCAAFCFEYSYALIDT